MLRLAPSVVSACAHIVCIGMVGIDRHGGIPQQCVGPFVKHVVLAGITAVHSKQGLPGDPGP